MSSETTEMTPIGSVETMLDMPPTTQPRRLLLSAKGIHKTYMSPTTPMARFWSAVFQKPPSGELFHVLKGIDVDIYAGETLGIMGRNGAGKSTLLGILAGVLPTSEGVIERHCRIAVLLELGAGFDMNLTGRENARAYCSIMGMSQREIDRKLPDIEAFADIEQYFDMPARTYSSGMYARLAFAAAIHVEADLVIVDETLSVGDAAFRLKCFKAIERRQADGTTFVMVSHNQNVIANFCSRAIVIEKGMKVCDDVPLEAVNTYKRIRMEMERRTEKSRNMVAQQALEKLAESDDEEATQDVFLRSIAYSQVTPENGPNRFIVKFALEAKTPVEKMTLHLMVRNPNGILVGALETDRSQKVIRSMAAGELIQFQASFMNALTPGTYFIDMAMWDEVEGGVDRRPVALYENCLRIDVVGKKRTRGLADLDFDLEEL